MKKEHNFIVCERCKKNEAVCIWDLHGEYCGCDVCAVCCSELTKEKQKKCGDNPMRKKTNIFDIKYGVLYLVSMFIFLLTWSFRDPYLNYLKIFKLEIFLSFACVTASAHVAALVLAYNKRKRKIQKILTVGLEIFFGLFSVCAVFSSRFKFNAMSIAIIVCLVALFIDIIILFFKERAAIKKDDVSNNSINVLIIVGFQLIGIGMLLLAIRDGMELKTFPFDRF